MSKPLDEVCGWFWFNGTSTKVQAISRPKFGSLSRFEVAMTEVDVRSTEVVDQSLSLLILNVQMKIQ